MRKRLVIGAIAVVVIAVLTLLFGCSPRSAEYHRKAYINAFFKWEFATPHQSHQKESHRFLRVQAHLATDFLSLPQEPFVHPRAKQNIHGSIVLI